MGKARQTNKRDLVHRRVFILGAGASASCGIAVAKDILREAVVRLGQRDAAKKKRIDDLVSYLYPAFISDLRNYPNIEDFLNLLEMAQSFNSEEFIQSSLWSWERLEAVKKAAMRAVTDYLWERIEKGDRLDPMKAFAARCLKLADTVVTFNWDVTLERGLWEREDEFRMPYTYRRKRRGKFIAILKPHGSVDWFREKDLSRKVARRTEKLDDDIRLYPHFNFAKHPELAKALPVIVPPVASKTFEYECMKKTWRSIYRAIADATELYVIGYSLPKEDQFARLVIRRALRSNLLKTAKGEKRRIRITVVNPDESTSVTFSRLAGPKASVAYYQATLQDFVEWTDPWKPEDS